MKALLTARRLKSGREEEFRRRWRGGATPDGMIDAFLLEDEQDPRETLSVSFWDTAQQLLKYRTSEEARRRREAISGLVDKDRGSRSFVAFGSWDIPKPGRGRALWLALPLLLSAGVGIYLALKRRGNADDRWDHWMPDTADSALPPEAAPVTPSRHAPEPDGRGGDGRVPGTATATEAERARSAAPAPPARTAPATPARSPGRSTAPGGTAAGAAAATATATATTTRGRGRTVAEVMTPSPETVDQMTDIATAARRMADLNVGVLPVTAGGRLAGVITDRDITLGMARQGRLPSEVRVQELMSELPATVRPDASVEEAARIMADRQIRRLPVVDGADLVGILSLGDVATEGDEAAAGTALREISK